MFRKLNNAVGLTSDLIRIGGALLVGYMMVFKVGLPLVSYGGGGGYVPLIIGGLAFASAAKRTYSLLR